MVEARSARSHKSPASSPPSKGGGDEQWEAATDAEWAMIQVREKRVRSGCTIEIDQYEVEQIVGYDPGA